MASSSAWGIDLGNRALKAVKLVRAGDRFRIEDFVVIEHEQILSVAGDNRDSLQKAALAAFVERHATRGSVVGVGVSGQSSFARFIKLPPVEPKKIPEIIRFEAIQQIPFPLDDVEWSYQLFQEKDSPDVEVGIFAMRKELVNSHIGMFTDLGLNVQVVQMNPLAIYNGMYFDDHTGQTTMFMDCGSENTDLVIADGQTVWLRTLPIGGNSFTEALTKAFKLNFAKAEELKRNAATSKYAKQIFQAMRPVFADLVSEIQRSIGFYASVHRDARIARIVALGSTFQLPGLQKYLQQNLQLPVEKLDAFKSLAPADGKQAATLSENVGTLAVAYGLALQAMGEAKIVSSLLPERIRRIKMWQEKRKWFAAAAATFVLAAAGVAGRYVYGDYQYRANSTLRENNQQVLSGGQGLSTDWTSNVQNMTEEPLKKVADVRGLLDYRGLWLDMVSDVMRMVPAPNPATLKATPRTQRRQILIDAFRTQYWQNMKVPLSADATRYRLYAGKETAAVPVIAPSMGGAGMDMGLDPMMEVYMQPGALDANMYPGAAGPVGDQVGAEADPNARRGFLITIRGVTPQAQQDATRLVSEELIQKLLKMDEPNQAKFKRPYFVARAELVSTGPRVVMRNGVPVAITELKDADELAGDEAGNINVINSIMPAAPAFDPMRGGIPAANQPTVNPLADRVFPDETIEKDTLFTILVAVVLDPKPSENTEGE